MSDKSFILRRQSDHSAQAAATRSLRDSPSVTDKSNIGSRVLTNRMSVSRWRMRSPMALADCTHPAMKKIKSVDNFSLPGYRGPLQTERPDSHQRTRNNAG